VSELERELLGLRHEVAWPPTPDLAAAVLPRVAAEPRRAARRWSWPAVPRLAAAAAVVLVLLATLAVLLAASPGVRATLRDWLGIGSVTVERVDRLPDVSPARELALGRRTTMAGAERALGGSVATVRALGAPDAIYVAEPAVPAHVSLVYIARPGLPSGTVGVGALLDEFLGGTFPYVEKLVAGGVPVTRVDVDGARGVFVGGRHALALPDELHPRIAGNTLVWARDGVTYRLETALGVRDALRLARSVG
jgi:hypothetical protein